MSPNTFINFRLFYNQTIHPELQRIEIRRKRLIILLFISIFIGAVLILLGVYIQSFLIILYILLGIGILIIYLIYRMRKFKKHFKPKIVELILQYLNQEMSYSNLVYHPYQTVEIQKILDSELFQESLDNFQGEDYISGTVGNSPFEFCELEIASESKIRPTMIPLFKGLFTIAVLPFSINDHLVIIPKEEKVFLSKTIKHFHRIGLKNVKLDKKDKNFNDSFLVFSNYDYTFNKIMANPIKQKLIQKLENDTFSYLVIKNNLLYLALSQEKDILEPRLWKTNIDFKLIQSFIEDIQSMFDLIIDFDNYN